jgi:hypothetical protein
MIKSSRNARRIVQARRDAAKAHRQGLHTLKSHALKAGLDASTASAVGGALRAKTKSCGVTGKSARMVRKMGEEVRFVRNARRYSRTDAATLAAAYAPKLNRYKDARQLVLAYAAS